MGTILKVSELKISLLDSREAYYNLQNHKEKRTEKRVKKLAEDRSNKNGYDLIMKTVVVG